MIKKCWIISFLSIHNIWYESNTNCCRKCFTLFWFATFSTLNYSSMFLSLSGPTMKYSAFHLFIHFKIIQNLIVREGGMDTTGLHVLQHFLSSFFILVCVTSFFDVFSLLSFSVCVFSFLFLLSHFFVNTHSKDRLANKV